MPRIPVINTSHLDRIDELLARPDFTESRSISALLLASKWLAEQES